MIYPLGYPTVDIEIIRAEVAAEYGLTVAQMDQWGRESRYTVPRMVAMALCVSHGHSTVKTAKAFNGRDHTPAINARKRVRVWMRESEKFAELVRTVARRCGIEESVAA